MIREERRRRVAAEIDENMRDLAEVSLAHAMAEENAVDMGNHLALRDIAGSIKPAARPVEEAVALALDEYQEERVRKVVRDLAAPE